MPLRARTGPEEPAVVPAPRYALTVEGLRTDLRCALCHKVTGNAVRPERVEHDVPFLLEQHRGRCGT